MTNGPQARVGQVMELPFGRPRNRTEVLEDPMYYDLRGCLVEFLEKQSHDTASAAASASTRAPAIVVKTRAEFPDVEPAQVEKRGVA